MIEDVETNKNIKQMVAELFSGTRKVKFLVVFILQSCFAVVNPVRLIVNHYFIMKIHNNKKIQHNVIHLILSLKVL